MFQHILISTDFSEVSRSAIGKGTQLARLCSAQVDLIHVISNLREALHTGLHDAGAQLEWEARLETNLDLALPDEVYPGVKKSLLWGPSIPGEILKHAVREKCDLIVCGSHGRNVFGRAFLGSVAQDLSRNSTIPVLVVPPVGEADFSSGIKSILVPVDFSVQNPDLLEFVYRMAEAFDSTIIFLHAIQLPAFAETMDAYPPMTIAVSGNQELKTEALTQLKKIAEGKIEPAHTKQAVTFGEPAREILRYAAENDCSCIVMGSHGRKGWERALLGSVTASVLTRTTVPVFTITPRF